MASGQKVCKSDEMVPGYRRYPRFPSKPNYLFFPDSFQSKCSLKFHANSFHGICIEIKLTN